MSSVRQEKLEGFGHAFLLDEDNQSVARTNLVVRELGIGEPERAVILAEAVAVRSAPAEDDDLTLFEVHEGTRVRIDQRTGVWAEVVLDDGKVGWVPLDVLEAI